MFFKLLYKYLIMSTPKYGVIALSNFQESNYEPFLLSDFKDINRAGVPYKALFAFSEWIDGGVFDFKFDNAIDYTNWMNDFIYIIIPSELVPNLTTMVDLVEDIVFEDQFDAVLDKQTITTRNGNSGDIITLSVKMTICKVIRWEQGDDDRLNSIIELFNSFYNPPRQITFPCKFNSLQELEDFKSLQKVN